MDKIIREILLVAGGVSTTLVLIFGAFYSVIKKVTSKLVENIFEKKAIKYANELDRATKAYEMLINREFALYERIDIYIAQLIILIQDMNSYATEPTVYKPVDAREKYKEGLVQYLEMIPKMKNEMLLKQKYVPDKVSNQTAELLRILQEKVDFLCDVYEKMREETMVEKYVEQMEETKKEILMACAFVEAVIKTRLENLSKVNLR